jgi:hypothetical protein
VHGVAEFIDELKTIRTPEDANAFDVLVNFAPEYLKDYVNRSGFSAARYFKEIAGRAGELRSNRQTVGIIGALYQPENIERFSTAIGYTKDRPHFQDDLFVWVVPNQSAWGASRSFLELVEILASEDRPIDQDGSRSRRNPVVIDEGKPQRRLSKRRLSKAVSTTYCRPNNGAIPGSLEVLLIPGRVAAAVVHAPITEGRGFPIPLGVLSFDEAIVRRVHEYLATQLPPHVTQYGSKREFALRNSLKWTDHAVDQNESRPQA